MSKLGQFKTEELSNHMRKLYTEYCDHVASLTRENRYLSSRLMSIRREHRIFYRLCLVSTAINGFLLGIML